MIRVTYRVKPSELIMLYVRPRYAGLAGYPNEFKDGVRKAILCLERCREQPVT
jgi:hypothetical protein